MQCPTVGLLWWFKEGRHARHCAKCAASSSQEAWRAAMMGMGTRGQPGCFLDHATSRCPYIANTG